MVRTNVEIKARCDRHDEIRALLRGLNGRNVGLDRQVDTYFRVDSGRLKLREGAIENALIHYRRHNLSGPKRSDVTLCRPGPDSGIGEVLHAALGTWKVVDKTRDIWFVDNVKIHLDDVVGLGKFVEIEAIDQDGTMGENDLRDQVSRFMHLFELTTDALVEGSYSDMIPHPERA